MEMRAIVASALLIAVALGSSASGLAVEPSTSAPRDPAARKTYRNPLLPDVIMADPHVIRVDGQYYLYATTHTRGYDVFVSDDLVNWRNAGRAFDDPRRGAWAPDVFDNRRGDGKFYLYYADNNADSAGPPKQIGLAVADSPLGPFVDKGRLVAGAIDAHLFQDDDGRLYLYYSDMVGGATLRVQPMADPLTKQGDSKVLVGPTEPWEKIGGAITEAPFVIKRHGVYYLMYSGASAQSPDYAIGYATATSPLGPFEKYPGNPIVRRGGSVLGPGHHCVIEGPDGRLWLVYHQKWNTASNFKRFLAIDPMWFDDRGVIHARPSRDTDEPVP
jgi:xylan 1,4-beta-xylosidase